jgi:hypothetical protein
MGTPKGLVDLASASSAEFELPRWALKARIKGRSHVPLRTDYLG